MEQLQKQSYTATGRRLQSNQKPGGNRRGPKIQRNLRNLLNQLEPAELAKPVEPNKKLLQQMVVAPAIENNSSNRITKYWYNGMSLQSFNAAALSILKLH